MKKLLVIPDIHGRIFWKKPCENIQKYEKVIFLGDYLDPYDFEHISVQDAITNFEEIIDFKKKNNNKVILLIGNHDLPYYSDDYYYLSNYHCRHSKKYHQIIHNLFEENKNLFQLAYVEKDILFTHAGVESKWLEDIVKCDENDINEICKMINNLTNSKDGITKLYYITYERGGNDKYGSCVWADVHDIYRDVNNFEDNDSIIKPIHKIKQIFGHTLQAFYNKDLNIEFGNIVEFNNCKMIDNANAYELDTDKFELKKVTL